MHPLKFENLYYEKIWGGRDLEIFRSNLPEGNIGESWDVACHENGMSIVANGEYKGMTLREVIEKQGEKLIGTKMDKEFFPLLVKLINAKDKLSVQVHPDDQYAGIHENDMGKTEAWYVVEALEGANLIVGTKDCTKEQFRQAIQQGTLNKYLNEIQVKKGEVYFIQSGLVHAIGEGVIIAEIQQNSDTTYRVFDYNRGRELHIDKALDVVDVSLQGEKSRCITVNFDGYSKSYHCLNKNFSLEVYDIKEQVVEKSDRGRFFIFTVVEGNGTISYSDGEEDIHMGDSILIPASLGEYCIKGRVKMIKSYVPDVDEVEKEILSYVKH